jgi:formylglycine-generating enzyme required for sulfatase activity
MKTNFSHLVLFLFAFSSCYEAPRNTPIALDNLADSLAAPPAQYNPDFHFDYPLAEVLGGVFRMGNTNGKKGYDRDECAHLDTVKNFKIGVYEVSKYQWTQVMGNNPGAFSDCTDCPAHYISWYDAQRFIQKLNAITRRNYRLPTEAEWEYAARGGLAGAQQNLIYAGGNTIDKVAWYNENSEKKPHPVGQKAPNALGIYDLSGNVREWCADILSAYPDCEVAASMSLLRCCRGGSWSSTYFGCRVSERMGVEPSARYLNMGLRLAHD